ncbi:phosphoribosylformylglycinamidine synthase 2 domain protein [Mycobacterium kansasii]|uniref:Phosphoribosylformylglycinamidine synthase 2 domain protein n=1 Tax=Mycobacterium kansasii TaxID=1768 RepID=A0A1V3WTX2_MYCKA|nr:phosphoribosylformylglycinamidine synthase 2 domain protein [Mycobacterium kansasii]
MVDGVVRGIGGYGNSLGLPNIGGETVFDPCYAGNPLVNALCVGVLRQEDLHLAFASGAGNKIILFGRAPGSTGSAGFRCWRRTPSVPMAPEPLPARSCHRCKWATPSPRRCSSNAASSSTRAGW